MSDYRRYFIAGGTFFFTVVAYRRRRLLTTDAARESLRAALAETRESRPFEMPAIVLLPDHLHTLWTLPPSDNDYSTRWRQIKTCFTARYLALGGDETRTGASRTKRGERGVWQRRFWEHLVRDEDDFERHFDYIHYNLVKHGHVECPRDWPYSTFERWVETGIYSRDWGCTKRGRLDFSDIKESARE